MLKRIAINLIYFIVLYYQASNNKITSTYSYLYYYFATEYFTIFVHFSTVLWFHFVTNRYETKITKRYN